MANLYIKGPDALKLISYPGINTFKNFPPNLAKQVIEKLNGGPFADIKFFRTDFINIKGRKVAALRHGMSGQPGLEVWGPYEEYLEIRGDPGGGGGVRHRGGRVPRSFVSSSIDDYYLTPYELGCGHRVKSELSLGVINPSIDVGTEVTLVWGEPDGGSQKASGERPHKQVEVRATVSPSRTTPPRPVPHGLGGNPRDLR